MVLGRDQVALLAVYLLAGIVLARLVWGREAPRVAARRSLCPLAAGRLGGLVTIALPVLLTVLVAADSNRPSIDYIGAGRGSLHPALFVTLFAPDLFGSSGEMGVCGARRASPGTTPGSTSRRTWASSTSGRCRCC